MSVAPAKVAPNAAAVISTGPRHRLMISRNTQQDLLENPAIKNDFYSKRFDAIKKKDDDRQKDLWSAVMSFEQAMLDCTLLNARKSDDSVTRDVVDGALVKGKEGDFLKVLCRHCHSPAGRALAIAILERTLEQDEWDESGQRIKEQHSGAGAPEFADDNDDTKAAPKEPSQKQEMSRMERFFSAGGLMILKQWLVDAMSPVEKPAKSKDPWTVAASSGPILLPLLELLKNAPFDKSLVTQSKINKQIRNLKKNLDEALEQRKPDEDVTAYRHPLAGGLVVQGVQKAVEALMSKWKDALKTSQGFAQDPFQALKDRMKEKLAVLKQYESGKIGKPAYLQKIEEADMVAKEKKIRSKLTTQQLAERERRQERERMLKHMKEKQKEASASREESLRQLREKLQRHSRKRMASGELKRQTQHTKKVKWRDGYTSDQMRDRRKLEQVLLIPDRAMLREQAEADQPTEEAVEASEVINVDEEEDDDDDDDSLWN